MTLKLKAKRWKIGENLIAEWTGDEFYFVGYDGNPVQIETLGRKSMYLLWQGLDGIYQKGSKSPSKPRSKVPLSGVEITHKSP